MAQLRDKQTSEFLAEGTPEEVALIALEVGPDEVLYDDVGPGFDPAAVLRRREEDLEGLRAVALDRELEKDTRDAAAARVGALRAMQADAHRQAGIAKAALEEARSRLER